MSVESSGVSTEARLNSADIQQNQAEENTADLLEVAGNEEEARNAEQTARTAQRNEADAGMTVDASKRRTERAVAADVEIGKVQATLEAILKDVDSIYQSDKQERVKRHYGEKRLGRINDHIAKSATVEEPLCGWDIVKSRLKTAGVKTLVGAGLTTAVAGILMAVSAPISVPVVAAGFAGSVVGRLAVEGVRAIRAKKEAKKYNEVEAGNQAFALGVQNLVIEANALGQQLATEHGNDYDIWGNEAYQQKVFEIFDLLHDDSKRRVERLSVEDDSGQKVDKYIFTDKEEGGNVVNLVKKEQEAVLTGKRWEIASDLGALVGSLGGAQLWRSMLEKGAVGAYHSAVEGTKHLLRDNTLTNKLADGTITDKFNFDSDRFAHGLRVVQQAGREMVVYVKDALVAKAQAAAHLALQPDMATVGDIAQQGGARLHGLTAAGTTLQQFAESLTKVDLATLISQKASYLSGLLAAGGAQLAHVVVNMVAREIATPDQEQFKRDKKAELRGYQNAFETKNEVTRQREASGGGSGGSPGTATEEDRGSGEIPGGVEIREVDYEQPRPGSIIEFHADSPIIDDVLGWRENFETGQRYLMEKVAVESRGEGRPFLGMHLKQIDADGNVSNETLIPNMNTVIANKDSYEVVEQPKTNFNFELKPIDLTTLKTGDVLRVSDDNIAGTIFVPSVNKEFDISILGLDEEYRVTSVDGADDRITLENSTLGFKIDKKLLNEVFKLVNENESPNLADADKIESATAGPFGFGKKKAKKLSEAVKELYESKDAEGKFEESAKAKLSKWTKKYIGKRAEDLRGHTEAVTVAESDLLVIKMIPTTDSEVIVSYEFPGSEGQNYFLIYRLGQDEGKKTDEEEDEVSEPPDSESSEKREAKALNALKGRTAIVRVVGKVGKDKNENLVEFPTIADLPGKYQVEVPFWHDRQAQYDKNNPDACFNIVEVDYVDAGQKFIRAKSIAPTTPEVLEEWRSAGSGRVPIPRPPSADGEEVIPHGTAPPPPQAETGGDGGSGVTPEDVSPVGERLTTVQSEALAKLTNNDIGIRIAEPWTPLGNNPYAVEIYQSDVLRGVPIGMRLSPDRAIDPGEYTVNVLQVFPTATEPYFVAQLQGQFKERPAGTGEGVEGAKPAELKIGEDLRQRLEQIDHDLQSADVKDPRDPVELRTPDFVQRWRGFCFDLIQTNSSQLSKVNVLKRFRLDLGSGREIELESRNHLNQVFYGTGQRGTGSFCQVAGEYAGVPSSPTQLTVNFFGGKHFYGGLVAAGGVEPEVVPPPGGGERPTEELNPDLRSRLDGITSRLKAIPADQVTNPDLVRDPAFAKEWEDWALAFCATNKDAIEGMEDPSKGMVIPLGGDEVIWVRGDSGIRLYYSPNFEYIGTPAAAPDKSILFLKADISNFDKDNVHVRESTYACRDGTYKPFTLVRPPEEEKKPEDEKPAELSPGLKAEAQSFYEKVMAIEEASDPVDLGREFVGQVRSWASKITVAQKETIQAMGEGEDIPVMDNPKVVLHRWDNGNLTVQLLCRKGRAMVAEFTGEIADEGSVNIHYFYEILPGMSSSMRLDKEDKTDGAEKEAGSIQRIRDRFGVETAGESFGQEADQHQKEVRLEAVTSSGRRIFIPNESGDMIEIAFFNNHLITKADPESHQVYEPDEKASRILENLTSFYITK